MKSACWTLCAVSVLTIATANRAFACGCATSPPCQAARDADVVFVGTVRSIDMAARDIGGNPRQSIVVKLNVEQGFVGASAGTATITMDLGSSCSNSFKTGEKYLVYARMGGDSQLTTNNCSRTRPVADAREDLQYLSTMGTLGSAGPVYGRINQKRRDPAEAEWIDFGRLEGIMVSVRGARFTRGVVSGADGRYEMSGLAPGNATISVISPFGFEPASFEFEIELGHPRGCREFNFSIRPIARASGIVVDASGRPLADVSVEAVARVLAGFDPPEYQSPARTDDRGAFEFRDLPPGKYVFGINLTKVPYSRSRDEPAVYLPGTAVASEAAVIELKAGDRKDVGTLRIVRQ
jgi:hypothetical protein